MNTSINLLNVFHRESEILPVVLCGGSGTRLWPLSRKAMPKQFVPLFKEASLLQLTLRRLKSFGTHILAVGNEDHRFHIQEAFEKESLQSTIFLEPFPKNTAAAMAIAALSVKPNQLLLFTPSDHYIKDTEAFAAAIKKGLSGANAGLCVTFGVVPDYPSTAYGYLRTTQWVSGADEHSDDTLLGTSRVEQFIEKPNTELAEHLINQGNCYWNAGIFLVHAKVLLEALHKHSPDILEICKKSMVLSSQDGVFIRPNVEIFSQCRGQSIDYAVLEKLDALAMVPFPGYWSDVGSWRSVAELYRGDEHNNRVNGQGYAIESINTFIHAEARPVVTLGTENLLVVDSPDAILIANISHSESVKKAVAILESKGVSQAVMHREVARPWCSFDSIDQGDRFQVKRITVKPRSRLSLQMHYHRAEHWIVVRGIARVTCGDQVFDLNENESTFIPRGTKHRLENLQDQILEIIEVQSGDYLGEDDIVRFEDNYGRV